MDDSDIMTALRQDLSVGTESFRDALLARCLEVLGQDDQVNEDDQVLYLSDDQLDMLAAAGDLQQGLDGVVVPPVQ